MSPKEPSPQSGRQLMSSQAFPIAHLSLALRASIVIRLDPGACAPGFMLSPAPQVISSIGSCFGRIVGFFLVVINSTTKVLLYLDRLLRLWIENLLQPH